MKKGDRHPLRTARGQYNLTIEGLAGEAKIGASTVWRAEHNYPINAESRRRLCAYFNKTAQELGLLNYTEEHIPAWQELQGEESSKPGGAEKAPAADLITPKRGSVEQLFVQREQLNTESIFEINDLTSLLDDHWTLDTMFDALRVILQGAQGLPERLRHTLLLDMLSKLNTVSIASSKHVSEGERHQVTEALNTSIAQSWQYFHTATPAQVLIAGQGLLYLLQRTEAFLSPNTYRSFYAAITNLIGSATLFQGFYDIAQQTHKRAYQAALEGSDVWNQAQSLNWQAIAANTSGKYTGAIQFIEMALRVLEGREEKDYLRLRAHLYADWAYNASILGEQALAQEKLDTSAAFLEHLEQNEEFDQARWHQLVGDCRLLNRQYAPAIYHLEQSLAQIPPQWNSRRILTLLPLARAYAYQQERDVSIAVAEQAADAIHTVASTMLKQRFVEYLHVLLELFPHDKTVRAFVTGLQDQLMLKS